MSDNPELYIRTDEKYERVRSEMRDLQIKQKDIETTVERIDKRVDFGVAITGQENAKRIAEQAVEIGKLKQTQEVEQVKLTNLDKNLGDKLDKIGKAVDLIYKGIVGIFFTLICGGGVLYALKFFKFS